MMVSTGISTFHEVSALLTRASQRIPIRLTVTKKTISRIATPIPVPLRVLVEP